MLKIYYNEKSDARNTITNLTIKGNYVKAEITDANGFVQGQDVISELESYNSYSLIRNPGIKVKIYREMITSNYRWVDLNRYCSSTKCDFADFIHFYSQGNIIQVDTGMISEDTKDIIVRLFVCVQDKINIDTDMEYTLEPFNSDDLVIDAHPRTYLWDSYSLTANGNEFKADRNGFIVSGDFDIPVHCEEGKDYIDFTITKYKGQFKSTLIRDIDDDEVYIDASAGLPDTRRVKLVNGIGHFRLLTFGYTGPIKLKLGRKWYVPWNDYLLTIGE